jgi:hypothetical protein
MSDVDKAKHRFQKAGLCFPPIPRELARKLKERGEWVFSTRKVEVSPYKLRHYADEAENTDVKDYALLAHSGHGVNSYAIQYYLVQGPLRMLLHLGWGGVYMNAADDAAKIRECFSMADQVIAAALSLGRLGATDRLILVGSDFYGSHWSPPMEGTRTEAAGRSGPLAVLTQARDWLTVCG